MALTDKQREHVLAFREEMHREAEAQRLAWDATVAEIQGALACLQERNYGLAESRLEALLDRLPNDHGGPVTYFDLLAEKRVTADARATLRARAGLS